MAARLEGWRRTAVSAALVGLTATVALYANRHLNGDIYWLLAAGREIAANGLPASEPFPTLNEGRAWENQQWLAELAFYGLERLGGLTLVSLAYSFVLGLSLLPLLLGSRNRRIGEVLAAWAFLLPLLVAVIDPRAAGFSLLCFSLLVVLVDGDRRRWRIWLIPLLVALWANLHGAFLVGLVLFALVAVGGALDARLGRRAESFPGRFLLLGLALPAMLVTPLATGIFDYLGALRGNPLLPELTFEWDPTWEHPALLLAIAALVGFAAYLLRRLPPPRPLEPVLVTAGFCALALTATRHLIWLGPVAFYLLRRIGPPGRIAVSRRWSLPALGGSAVLVSVWLAALAPAPNERKLATTLVEQVRRHPVDGRLAAPAGTGSLLLWRAPGQAVTIDGRFENYPAEELRAAYDLLRGERLELLRPWGIAGVITSHERAVEPLSRRGFRVERRSEGSLLLTRP
ncbi:MAG: hypothetical protein H0T39_14445 [Actinobacteria bacterium]|nr:hypothetical protein [Actinomycetota bacterium]